MTVNEKNKKKRNHMNWLTSTYLMLVFDKSNKIKLAEKGKADATKQMWRCRMSTSGYSSMWAALIFSKK